jgi:hypothetical protein
MALTLYRSCIVRTSNIGMFESMEVTT